LHNFTAVSFDSGANTDGRWPLAGLIKSDDSLYGTTGYGGSLGWGTVFRLSFAPELAIVRSGANVILTWPTNMAGFDDSAYTLESATNLNSPSWDTNSQPTNSSAGQRAIAQPIRDSQQFFRLRK
jgi:uncharacterized repeat protein (TIGR03803 family)